MKFSFSRKNRFNSVQFAIFNCNHHTDFITDEISFITESSVRWKL